MEAILLYILLNETHLYSPTQERFILNQNINYICVCYIIRPVHLQARQYNMLPYKGIYNKNLRGPLFTVIIFYNAKKYEG